MCLNMYDVRYEDTHPACGMNWPPEMHAITDFLGRDGVVHALHANAHPGTWRECRSDVHRAFREAKEQSSITILPNVLSKIPVLIYAGDQDLICNYVGLENMIKVLKWNGETGLGTVQTQSWNVNGTSVGTWVNSRNLTYVKVFNASHMVPFDLPHVTHDMMLRFMNVNFSAIYDGTARIPSSLGASTSGVKPLFLPSSAAPTATSVPVQGKTPEQEKAMWEAYYNAGSATLVLVLILAGIGAWLWFRNRRGAGKGLQLPLAASRDYSAEESIPLNPNGVGNGLRDTSQVDLEPRSASLKGKERARAQEAIFEVGDTDDEDDHRPNGSGHR